MSTVSSRYARYTKQTTLYLYLVSDLDSTSAYEASTCRARHGTAHLGSGLGLACAAPLGPMSSFCAATLPCCSALRHHRIYFFTSDICLDTIPIPLPTSSHAEKLTPGCTSLARRASLQPSSLLSTKCEYRFLFCIVEATSSRCLGHSCTLGRADTSTRTHHYLSEGPVPHRPNPRVCCPASPLRYTVSGRSWPSIPLIHCVHPAQLRVYIVHVHI